MKVALFGGTGFVGSYLIRELINNDHIPRVLVRDGSEDKLTNIDSCEVVMGEVTDQSTVMGTIDGCEAVIYNIGIIRQFPKRGITFEKLHFESAKKVIRATEESGLKRFIMMSANGVKPNGTGYQKTKWLAEQLLKSTDLKWTIFRPSLIFGDPGSRNCQEFCTQLKENMLGLPFPAPIFYKGLNPFNAGDFAMSPIHAKDVAKFFVQSISMENTHRKIYELGGAETVKWNFLLNRITSSIGKNKWGIPVPIIFVKMAAFFLERFSGFPVTRGQLTMLMEGNTVEKQYFSDFEISPTRFDNKTLSYLKTN